MRRLSLSEHDRRFVAFLAFWLKQRPDPYATFRGSHMLFGGSISVEHTTLDLERLARQELLQHVGECHYKPRASLFQLAERFAREEAAPALAEVGGEG